MKQIRHSLMAAVIVAAALSGTLRAEDVNVSVSGVSSGGQVGASDPVPIVLTQWSLTMHEAVGPHPGAEFHGSFTSWPASFHEEGSAIGGMPPNVWSAGLNCCDIVIEGVHYGYSHNMGFMINQPTFDHDLIFDALFTLDSPLDLWFGLPRLADGSANPTPYFRLSDGSVSGLYEVHRVSEPGVVALLALMLGGLLIRRQPDRQVRYGG